MRSGLLVVRRLCHCIWIKLLAPLSPASMYMKPVLVGGAAFVIMAFIQAMAFESAHPASPAGSTIKHVNPFVPGWSVRMDPSLLIWTMVALFTTEAGAAVIIFAM